MLLPPDFTSPERGEGTDFIALYDQCKPYFELSYRSETSLRILFLLRESPLSLSDLAGATGIRKSTLLPKIRTLEVNGLIDRNERGYTLTNSGKMLVPRFIDLLRSYATANQTLAAGDRESSATVPWDTSAALKDDLQSLLRSSVSVRILLDCAGSPGTRDRLRKITGCGSPALTPRIRWLEQKNLIAEDGYTYLLTPAGRAVTAALEAVIGTIVVLVRHRLFWNTHYLERLPDFARDSMSDLMDAEIIRDDPTNYFLNFEHYLAVLKDAEYIHGVTTMGNPSIADAIGVRVAMGVPAEIIVSPELAYQLHQEPYLEKVNSLAPFKKLQFFVTDLPVPLAITITNTCLSGKLFLMDGVTYDTMNGLYCTSPEGRAWGERLFQYYKQHSTPIAEYLGKAQNNAGDTP